MFLELGLLCVTMLLVFAVHCYTRKKYNLPPGPRGWPVVGLLSSLNHNSLWNHKDKYGDVTYFKISGKPVVVLHSIDAIREAFLCTNGAFDDRPNSFFKTHIVGKDVIFNSIKEPYWPKLRKIMHSSIKSYGSGVSDIEKIVTEELECSKNWLASKKNKPFDIRDMLYPSLCNILFNLLVNKRFDYSHRMIQITTEQLNNMCSLGNVTVSIMLKLFPLLRKIPIGIGKTIQSIHKTQDELVQYAINLEKTEPDVSVTRRKGIVFDLLQGKNKHEWLNDKHVIGAIENIFGAGLLTTMNTLHAFFLILTKNPEVQLTIQKEIDDTIERIRLPKVEDRCRMPYTQAVIFELLRYSSVVDAPLPRLCDRDTQVAGYDIPSGTIAIINLFRVHHDPDLWENPWKFDPSRFLDNDDLLLPASHPNRKNILAFGLGTRACLGEVFAKTRLFLYITCILQKFTFTLCASDSTVSEDPRDYDADRVIHPSPYKLIATPRD